MGLDVSVIVVSRNRDGDLSCLIEVLKWQQGIAFELVIVTNTPEAIVEKALAGQVATYLYCDVANISVMRNLGLAVAASDYVAFIDDDALPEPDWLLNLVANVVNGRAASATGPVYGRSGMAIHYGVTWTNYDGVDVSVTDVPEEVEVFRPTKSAFPRVQGCNAAFDKKVIEGLGGFDPGYAYYLDETDLSLRLAQSGHSMAFAPKARVHHLSSANETRSQNRRPTTWATIGRSIHHYCEKNTDDAQRAKASHVRVFEDQLRRGLVAGTLEPRDVLRLRREITAPQSLALPDVERVAPKGGAEPFRQTPLISPMHLIFAAQEDADAGLALAQAHRQSGAIVTLVTVDRSLKSHRLNAAEGIYRHEGGLWGRLNGVRRMRRFDEMLTEVLEFYKKRRAFSEVFVARRSARGEVEVQNFKL